MGNLIFGFCQIIGEFAEYSVNLPNIWHIQEEIKQIWTKVSIFLQFQCKIFGIYAEYLVFSGILGILQNIQFPPFESAEYSVSADRENLGLGRSLTSSILALNPLTKGLVYFTICHCFVWGNVIE